MQTAGSQVARIDVQADDAMPSHTTSNQYDSQGDVSDDATTLGMDGGSNDGEPEADEAVMDDYRPGIFLIDLPPMWFQLSTYGVSVRFLRRTLNESVLYQLVQDSGGPFDSPKS